MNQGVGNAHAVARRGEQPGGFVGAHIEGGLRRDAGVRDASRGRDGPNAARREPAAELQQRTVLRGVGENPVDGAVERQFDGGHGTVSSQTAQTVNATVHDAQIEAVARPGHVLDHHRSLRHDFGRGREIRCRCAGLENSSARRAPVGDDVEILPIDLRRGDLILEIRDLHPARLVAEHVRERRDIQPRLRPHVGEGQEHEPGSRKGHDEGHLDGIEVDPRDPIPLHQDGVVCGTRSEPVKARAAVEEALRRIDGARQLVVKEARAVVEPLRRRGLRVLDAFRQHPPRVDGQHVQRRILAPILGQPIRNVPAIRRGLPPIHG